MLLGDRWYCQISERANEVDESLSSGRKQERRFGVISADWSVHYGGARSGR